jgi:hypothetical protein
MQIDPRDGEGSPPTMMNFGNPDWAAPFDLQFAKNCICAGRIGDWRWIGTLMISRGLTEQIKMHEWRCLDWHGCIVLRLVYAGPNWPVSITSLEACEVAHALLYRCTSEALSLTEGEGESDSKLWCDDRSEGNK